MGTEMDIGPIAGIPSFRREQVSRPNENLSPAPQVSAPSGADDAFSAKEYDQDSENRAAQAAPVEEEPEPDIEDGWNDAPYESGSKKQKAPKTHISYFA
jgi:hypothetical protein